MLYMCIEGFSWMMKGTCVNIVGCIYLFGGVVQLYYIPRVYVLTRDMCHLNLHVCLGIKVWGSGKEKR